MSNSFNIDVKPEIAANLVKILSNASALGTIQITTLPDIATQNTDIKSAVDAIANPQLPEILTAVGSNETKIDANKDVLDLIHASEYSITGSGTLAAVPQTTWTEILSITGSGKFNYISAYIATGNINIRITIDGVICDRYIDAALQGNSAYIAVAEFQIIQQITGTHPPRYTNATAANGISMVNYSLKFKTSLLIEVYADDNLQTCTFEYAYCLS